MTPIVLKYGTCVWSARCEEVTICLCIISMNSISEHYLEKDRKKIMDLDKFATRDYSCCTMERVLYGVDTLTKHVLCS